MTSVERVMTYAQLTQEPGFTTRAQPPVSWPTKGDLSIKDLSLTYVEGGLRILKKSHLQSETEKKLACLVELDLENRPSWRHCLECLNQMET